MLRIKSIKQYPRILFGCEKFYKYLKKEIKQEINLTVPFGLAIVPKIKFGHNEIEDYIHLVIKLNFFFLLLLNIFSSHFEILLQN